MNETYRCVDRQRRSLLACAVADKFKRLTVLARLIGVDIYIGQADNFSLRFSGSDLERPDESN